MNRIEKFLFQITIFLIPTNLAWHLITNDAFVNGILVDYLIPKLYLSDLPILLLFLLWLLKTIKLHLSNTSRRDLEVNQTKSITKWSLPLFLSAGLILLFKAFLTTHPLAGIWYFLKLLELSLFYFWIKCHFLSTQVLKTIVPPLVGSMLFQSLLALYQFLAQHSLAGYWFLGETTLTFTANIAKAVVWPFEGLRILPYGTTPHPNVLAGFLAVGLIILISQWRRLKLPSALKFLVLTFALLVIYLTQSLTAWFALAVGLFILFQTKAKPTFMPIFLFALTLFIALYLTPSLNFSERWCHPERVWQNVICQTVAGPSFQRRQQLNNYAIRMFLDHPLSGIGLNQFTAVLPAYGTITAFTSFLQPAHNIYLLWLAETGLVGIIFLLSICCLMRGSGDFLSTSKYLSRRLMGVWYFLKKTRTWLKAKFEFRPTNLSHVKSFVFEKNTKHPINQTLAITNQKKFAADWIVMIPVSMLLLIGLADHYPLTLQIGQLIFILSLALCRRSESAS